MKIENLTEEMQKELDEFTKNRNTYLVTRKNGKQYTLHKNTVWCWAECDTCGKKFITSDHFATHRKFFIACCGECAKKWIEQHPGYKKRPKNPETEQHKKVNVIWKAFERKHHIIPEPCWMCGSTDGIAAHHEDYSRPFYIMWLCKNCHSGLPYRRYAPAEIKNKSAYYKRWLGRTPIDYSEIVSKNLKELRKTVKNEDILDYIQKHLTCSAVRLSLLAEKLNMSKSNLSAILNGTQKLTAENLFNICLYTGINLKSVGDYFWNKEYPRRKKNAKN